MSTQKTFHIELRCMNVDSAEKFDSLQKAIARAARTVHAQAMLVLSGTTPPLILIYGEDFLKGREEIDVMAGDDE